VTAIITEDAVLLAFLAVAGLRAAARLLSRRLSRQRPEDDRVPAPPVPAGRRAYLGVPRPQSQLVRPYVLYRAPRRPARAQGGLSA
jgi:hypothetical protein